MTGVEFAVPAGACDCHIHVFPDAARAAVNLKVWDRYARQFGIRPKR